MVKVIQISTFLFQYLLKIHTYWWNWKICCTRNSYIFNFDKIFSSPKWSDINFSYTSVWTIHTHIRTILNLSFDFTKLYQLYIKRILSFSSICMNLEYILEQHCRLYRKRTQRSRIFLQNLYINPRYCVFYMSAQFYSQYDILSIQSAYIPWSGTLCNFWGSGSLGRVLCQPARKKYVQYINTPQNEIHIIPPPLKKFTTICSTRNTNRTQIKIRCVCFLLQIIGWETKQHYFVCFYVLIFSLQIPRIIISAHELDFSLYRLDF